jgi:hypothetical protein
MKRKERHHLKENELVHSIESAREFLETRQRSIAGAAAKMVRKLGGDLQGLAFLIELQFLNGRSKLADEKVFSVLQY